MVIKLPISVRDEHLLLARFSKNQVYMYPPLHYVSSQSLKPTTKNENRNEDCFLSINIQSGLLTNMKRDLSLSVFKENWSFDNLAMKKFIF